MNNKWPTNSFNKQFPIGMSHDAEGPQLECSQGPAVVHYTKQSAPEAQGPVSSSLCLLSMKIVSLRSPRREAGSPTRAPRERAPSAAPGTGSHPPSWSRLKNARNNKNINTTSHIPHLELMSRATLGAQAYRESFERSGKTNFPDNQSSQGR